MDIKKRIDQIIEAILTRGSLDVSSGGAMPAESLQEFLKSSGGEGVALLENIRKNGCWQVVKGDTFKIPTIGLAPRQLQKATSGTEPESVASLTTDEGNIAMTEVVFPIDLNYEQIEDAIGKADSEAGGIAENAKLDQLIGDLANAAFLRDVQDLIINGDTGSGTTFLKTMNGLIKGITADGTTYDPGSAETIAEHLRGLINAAPANIKGRTSELVIYMNTDDYSDLQDLYGARNTALGDSSLMQDNAGTLKYKGIACVELDHLPAQTNLLAFSKAIWLGFKRNISIERMRQPRKRIVEVTMSARFGHAEIYPFCVLGVRSLT